MKIIGINGTNGAGKDTLGEWLEDKKGWLFISVSAILREELERRGLPIERENLRNLSAEWRRERGLGVLVDMAVSEYQEKGGDRKFKGLVISSIRNPGEADRIHELGGKVVWVDADPQLRYQRIMGRKRSTEDTKTYEQFLAEEQAEMTRQGDDTSSLDMSAVKEKSDLFIQNDTTRIEDFIKLAEKELDFAAG